MDTAPAVSWWTAHATSPNYTAFYQDARRQMDRMAVARVNWPNDFGRPRDDGFRPGKFSAFSPWNAPHVNY